MHKVNSVRSLWLARVTPRYGGDKDKVCYERQMALIEAKGLTDESGLWVQPLVR